MTYEQLRPLFEAAALKYSVSPLTLGAIATIESGMDPSAQNASYPAVGLMQVVCNEVFPDRPSREQLLDPATNIDWGARILAGDLATASGDMEQALYFYSGGGYWGSYQDYLDAYWSRYVAAYNSLLQETPLTDFTRYPRPPDDTGAGYHMGANAYFPVGDNDGLIPGVFSEMHHAGLRWAKLLDAEGSAYNATRMCVQAGLMPVIRLYRLQPYPGQLTQKQKDSAKALAGLGAVYFERGNEPNLVGEWQDGKWPGDSWNPWPDAVYDALAADWMADATYLANLGAFVALDAPSGGGNHDDVTYFAGILKALKRIDGAASLLHDHGWIACHPAGLNHPLDYPDDARNQQDHPGVTILGSIAGEQPSSPSNCIRKPEKYHQMFLDAFGFDIPIMATEGGFWPGFSADPRYPALTNATSSQMTTTWLRSMKTAPAWFLAAMPWLWANRIFANKREGFERDAVKRIPGWGNCPAGDPPTLPLLADLLSNPCQKREVSSVPEPSPTPSPQPVAPVGFTDAEMQRARQVLGVIPATIKAANDKGYTWLKELYSPGDAYAFALCAVPGQAGQYRLLKLETQSWQTVAEASL